MELRFDLSMKQTQKLAMTQELVQSIKLLQYNSQELTAYIEKEMLENPTLETASSDNSSSDDFENGTNSDAEANGIDKEVNHEEFDFVDALLQDDSSYDYYQRSYVDSEMYAYKEAADSGDTLIDHLRKQIYFKEFSAIEEIIVKKILDEIDDDGYLNMPVEDIAADLDVDVETVEKVLSVIQTLDPCGVAARDLAECITIQLKAKGLFSDELDFILNEMFDDFANKRIVKIAKKMSMTPKDVQTKCCDLIKTLDPKPGRNFCATSEFEYIIPEIFVEKEDGEYVVSMNEKGSPALMVSPYYKKLHRMHKNDEEVKNYLRERINSAIWLIKAINQRRNTIYNIACRIVKHQEAFMEHGSKYLKQLTLKQIAEETEVHESTVSRAINGKYMQTSRGVFELKYFFSSGLSVESNEDLSANSIKIYIKEIIENEDSSNPYSDSQIVDLLKDKDIDISRRTVAKYRESMGLLSSSKRKRF